MRRLKVAVIGYGVMGKYHANVYAALPHTDLVAVVDPLPVRRREAQKTHAVTVYADSTELLASEKPDAVSIAAPTSLHYSLARRFLEAGVHVLVEKPVAADVAQAQDLASLSRRSGLVLQVGHITRFYSSVQLLNKRVGRPYLIEARRLATSARVKDVGVILDLMIHDIDIVLGMIPGCARSVTVAGHILNGSPFEDVAVAQIVFANGCIARFLASRVATEDERTLVVAEARQTQRLDFGKEPYTEVAIYRPFVDEAGASHVRMELTTVQEDNPLRKELEHFLARIQRGAKPIGTLEDDLRSLQLASQLMAKLKPQRSLQAV
jgi:predicted dehydrogenase